MRAETHSNDKQLNNIDLQLPRFMLCLFVFFSNPATDERVPLLRSPLTNRPSRANSFRITSLADPHPLTPSESHPYEKPRGAGVAKTHFLTGLCSLISGRLLSPLECAVPRASPVMT